MAAIIQIDATANAKGAALRMAPKARKMPGAAAKPMVRSNSPSRVLVSGSGNRCVPMVVISSAQTTHAPSVTAIPSAKVAGVIDKLPTAAKPPAMHAMTTTSAA